MQKKSFLSNSPSLNFISRDTIEAVDGKTEQRAGDTPKPKAQIAAPPTGYKINPEYIEIKSRRVQILMQPSLYEEVKARAQAEEISVNEAITQALQAYITKER